MESLRPRIAGFFASVGRIWDSRQQENPKEAADRPGHMGSGMAQTTLVPAVICWSAFGYGVSASHSPDRAVSLVQVHFQDYLNQARSLCLASLLLAWASATDASARKFPDL
jgi:hypothetical protein